MTGTPKFNCHTITLRRTMDGRCVPMSRTTPCSLSKATTSLVHVVAASWCLGKQLKAPQPDHSYTFFSAKIAATFIQLNPKCAHGPCRCIMPSVRLRSDALLADDRANAIGCANSSNLYAPLIHKCSVLIRQFPIKGTGLSITETASGAGIELFCHGCLATAHRRPINLRPIYL